MGPNQNSPSPSGMESPNAVGGVVGVDGVDMMKVCRNSNNAKILAAIAAAFFSGRLFQISHEKIPDGVMKYVKKRKAEV